MSDDFEDDKENHADYLYMAGKCMRKNNFVGAELAYSKHLKIHKDDTVAMMCLGVALCNQNRFGEAEKYFRDVIDICDRRCLPEKKFEARHNLAVCLGRQRGMEDQAEELFLELIQEDQSNPYSLHAYADFLSHNDRLWEAKDMLEKAINIFFVIGKSDSNIVFDYYECRKKLHIDGGLPEYGCCLN